jgi:DNA-binding SARP family transcriptional activator
VSETRLSLLRGFELEHEGAPVYLPHSAERVLAFVALHRRRMLRAYVSGVLWTDHTQEAANASLRTALWRMRRPFALIEASSSHVSLVPSVSVDLHRMSAAAHNLTAGVVDEDAVDELLEVGELLPDWYEDWVVIERERFRQRRLNALEALCDSRTRQGRYAEAVDAGLSAVVGEPLRESTHRALMRAHLAQGNRSEALRQYLLCRKLLREQLGVRPTVETEQLRARCELAEGLRTTSV